MSRKPNWSQGHYTPKNPKKYIGKSKITYRSSWELTFCTFCDNNDHILEWASEEIRIPYRHPLTGKQSMYVPDFLIRYRDKNNKVITELIEIKPRNQSVIEAKGNPKMKATIAVNYFKWDAASKWCKQNGIKFRVVTENDMFANGKK